MSRKLVIAGNWKMNNTIDQTRELIHAIKKRGCLTHKVDIVVAPPFTALRAAAKAAGDTSIQVAAQNVFWEESGAYTGEVSPIMIKEAGAKWVIVGHSERRQYFGETDETVNRRLKAALAVDLKVIVCVGEMLEEREAGQTFAVLDRQTTGAFTGVGAADLEQVVIAYEPVWAIGTGKTATADQADEAHAHIRARVAALYTPEAAAAMRILYGGSVKPPNAKELIGREHVDGALIGGASLKAADFCAVITAGLETHA
ncbi:MAG: triose-phosphate isomerase [Nitrospinae bacterium]|nr:triose-phosphate isomerase [Nitrospinota bacterium]